MGVVLISLLRICEVVQATKKSIAFHLKASVGLSCPCESPASCGWASLVLTGNSCPWRCKMKLLDLASCSVNLQAPCLRSAKMTSCLGAAFWISCVYLAGEKEMQQQSDEQLDRALVSQQTVLFNH